jgi:glycosyltransferase involved in cell wall biosynthesis
MSRAMPSPQSRPSLFFAVASTPNRIGGFEIFAVELARQLDALGWNITVCFQGYPPALVESFLLSPGNVSLAVMPQQLGLGLANTREFLQLVRKHRPTVLLYTLGGAVRLWPLLGKFVGIKRSFYWDGTSRSVKNFDYQASLPIKLLMKPLVHSACATRFVKSRSDKEGIVPAQKSHVIYNSVDNHRELGDGKAFRQRYHIPEDRIVVLTVSWLIPEKGIDLALRAAKLALEKNQTLQFVFCGDGANRTEYEKLASDLGIADHVTWTGQLEDIAASGVFRASDIQIQCSQWHEAFCLAVAEGMSAGLPVVAARIGGLPELVEDRINGFLFDHTSEEQLAQGILALAADESLRHTMGLEGRQRALANFDVVQNVKRYLEMMMK